jgi:6-phosphogluconolactonase (cycloisomerase 2 family)
VANEDCPGTLQAYSVDPADGALEPLGEPVSSVGRAPCYAALDVSGRWCFAANYVEGSIAVCPVLADGSLGPATDSKHHQGADEIDEALHDRQEGSHCHCVLVHPSNQWVIACDLGLSAVFVYGFDARRGTLSGAADDPRHLRLSAEAGCRHACWNATGTVLFVNNELTCSVTVAHFDVATGRLVEHQTVPRCPLLSRLIAATTAAAATSRCTPTVASCMQQSVVRRLGCSPSLHSSPRPRRSS